MLLKNTDCGWLASTVHFLFFFWQLTRFSELTGFGWIAIVGLLVILHWPFSFFFLSILLHLLSNIMSRLCWWKNTQKVPKAIVATLLFVSLLGLWFRRWKESSKNWKCYSIFCCARVKKMSNVAITSAAMAWLVGQGLSASLCLAVACVVC